MALFTRFVDSTAFVHDFGQHPGHPVFDSWGHCGGTAVGRSSTEEGPFLGERLTAATVVGTALMLVAIAGLAVAESRPDAKS